MEYQEGVPERWEQDRAALMVILDFDPEDDPLESVALSPLEMVLVASPTAQPHYELVVKDSASRYRRQPKTSFEGGENVVYLSDFHSKRVAALQGVGVGWMPEHLVREDLAQGRLIGVEDKRWTYHPRVVWRRKQALGRAARLFVEKLQQD